jgi:predicted Zn-dependent peptidase
MPEVASVCAGVWVGAGSRDETDAEAGISHFLEHLLFKGTDTRSARDIAEAVDEVGGDMNAYTTKEYTTFYVRLLADHQDLGLDILCDILQDPALRRQEVDAERQVILEEILMHLDEPADVVQENFACAMFPGHQLGREVLGLPEVVKGVGVDEIRRFFEDHYRPRNMVVAAAGAIDHEAVAEGIERRFAGRSGGRPPTRQAPAGSVVPRSLVTDDTEQAHLVYGVRAPKRRSPERFSLAALNHILGGGLSSRLFQKVREERGLAYSIGSDRVAYDDAGALAVSVGTAPGHAAEVLSLIEAEFDALVADGVTPRELEVAKRHLHADLLLSLEDSGARMSRIGASLLLHGEVLTVEETLERIRGISEEEVGTVARELFSQQRVLAVVGPFEEDEFPG